MKQRVQFGWLFVAKAKVQESCRIHDEDHVGTALCEPEQEKKVLLGRTETSIEV